MVIQQDWFWGFQLYRTMRRWIGLSEHRMQNLWRLWEIELSSVSSEFWHSWLKSDETEAMISYQKGSSNSYEYQSPNHDGWRSSLWSRSEHGFRSVISEHTLSKPSRTEMKIEYRTELWWCMCWEVRYGNHGCEWLYRWFHRLCKLSFSSDCSLESLIMEMDREMSHTVWPSFPSKVPELDKIFCDSTSLYPSDVR
jgi:hypothetical protein